MRTRQLIEEMRRDNDRRERESQERIEAMWAESREWQEEAAEEWRRFRQECDERKRKHDEEHGRLMRQHDEEHRRLMREVDEQIREQRLGFNITYGALSDLAREIRSWRDEGGPAAA